MRVANACLVILFASLVCVTAEATPLTKHYSFSATNFNVGFPEASVSGDFSFSYDDAVTFYNDIVPDAVNVTIHSFTYTTSNTAVDILTASGQTSVRFGGTIDTNNLIGGGKNDFDLAFVIDSTSGNILPGVFPYFFIYATPDTLNNFRPATPADLTVTDLDAPTGVPEPASIVLLGFGLIGVGLASQRGLGRRFGAL